MTSGEENQIARSDSLSVIGRSSLLNFRYERN